jgi:hypothetical protein
VSEGGRKKIAFLIKTTSSASQIPSFLTSHNLLHLIIVEASFIDRFNERKLKIDAIDKSVDKFTNL